jgi:hypothetical protein
LLLVAGKRSLRKFSQFLPTDGIRGHLFLVFVAVTGMASKRKIIEIIAAAKNAWDDVFDWKSRIEKSFRGMAVFTKMAGSLRNDRV